MTYRLKINFEYPFIRFFAPVFAMSLSVFLGFWLILLDFSRETVTSVVFISMLAITLACHVLVMRYVKTLKRQSLKNEFGTYTKPRAWRTVVWFTIVCLMPIILIVLYLIAYAPK